VPSRRNLWRSPMARRRAAAPTLGESSPALKERRSAASAARAVMTAPSTPPPASLDDGILLLLAALVGKSCAHAKRAIGSGQAAALPLGGDGSADVVYHFWAEGLALTCVHDVVDEIEIFGDSHPFHQRALGQPLMNGIAFGAPRQQVEAVLGVPIGEGPGGSHGSVGRWLFYGPWILHSGWLRRKNTVTLALFFEDGEGAAASVVAAATTSEPTPGVPLDGLQAVRILQCNDREDWCRKHSV